MSTAPRQPHTFSLQQAAQAAPTLAALQERILASQRCMERIAPLIPANLRRQVQAGPIDDEGWCLLVSNTAASTKLRQLRPALLQALHQAGMQVSAIRIKVQASPR